MICVQFIFKPGGYDEDFHRLDDQIEKFARGLPGTQSLAQLSRFPQHLQAKEQVRRWYDGYRIIVSEITATYGDGRLDLSAGPGRP